MATKKTTKKAAAPKKKAAKSKSTANAPEVGEQQPKSTYRPVHGPTVSIFDESVNPTAQAKDMLSALLSARKNRPNPYLLPGETEVPMFELPHFYLKQALRIKGIPRGVWIDIVGAEHIGKTTLMWTLFGGFVTYSNAYCLWVNTEGKPFPLAQKIRCMHADPKVANLMRSKAIVETEAHSQDELAEVIEDWVLVMRGVKKRGKEQVVIPIHQPLVIGIDTMSKLMSPDEAKGFYNFGKNMDEAGKKARKEVGEGSNFGHSKFNHGFARRMSYFLKEYNVLVLANHHQNDKINMSSGFSTFQMSEDTSALHNKTKIGGRAFNQTAGIQIILAGGATVKDSSGNVIGKQIKARVDKNSFGPNNVKLEWLLRSFYPLDDFTRYLQPAIDFDEAFMKWLVEGHHLDVEPLDGGRWSCKSLSMFNVLPVEISYRFHQDPEMQNHLGRKMKIAGYINILEEIERSGDLSAA